MLLKALFHATVCCCHVPQNNVQYKTIIKFGFGDIWNNQGLGKCYKPSLSLIYLSHKPHLIFMNIVYNLLPFSPALLCGNSRATSLFVPFSVDYLFQLMLLALILSNTDLPNMVNVSWL